MTHPKYSVSADAKLDTHPDRVEVIIREGWWIRFRCALYLLFKGKFVLLGRRTFTYPDKDRG